jgi:hypothetical protein
VAVYSLENDIYRTDIEIIEIEIDIREIGVFLYGKITLTTHTAYLKVKCFLRPKNLHLRLFTGGDCYRFYYISSPQGIQGNENTCV